MNRTARLLVGIDIGRTQIDLALLHPEGQPLVLHQNFANAPSGYRSLKQRLLQTLSEQGLQGLDVAVEATSYYWLPLYIQLSQDPELAAYEPRLALLNAGWVKWYKKSFSPDHKSDQSDPFYIADRLRTLHDPLWWEYDPHWLKLRLLTRWRVHLSQDLARQKNYYQLFLFLAYSQYGPAQPFSDPFGVLSQELLGEEPEELAHLLALSPDELAEQLAQRAHGHLPDPHGNAERLQRALRESYPLSEPLQASVHLILRSQAALIQTLQQAITEADRRIEACLQSEDYPEVGWLDSVPGLGRVFAAAIAAEIGDIQRFASPRKWDPHRQAYRARNAQDVEDALAKYAGLWWPRQSSGQFEAEERPLSKRGNAYLRYAILLAADSLRRHVPRYARYYQTKYEQATKHPHKRALVLTGRKALALWVGLLLHRESYRAEED